MKADQDTESILESLTEKQKTFCREYIYDWNGTRAAIVAGYSEKTAAVTAHENLRKPNIQQYIKEIQADIEKQAGISRLRVLEEYQKIAFTTIAHLHNTWIELKEFEQLTDDQKACIESIETKTIKRVLGDNEEGVVMHTEYVKIKLFSKEKALESICKMLGYNAPDKIDHTTGGEKINTNLPPIIIQVDEDK